MKSTLGALLVLRHLQLFPSPAFKIECHHQAQCANVLCERAETGENKYVSLTVCD